MNGTNTMNLEHFEVVTAITQMYADDIESYLIKEYDEVLQIDFAELVMKLYFEYTKDTTAGSLLSMINNKTIPLSQVM